MEQRPDISVVVLAFREGPSIKPLTQNLEEHLRKAQLHYEIIIVSNYKEGLPDETPAIVRRLSQENPRIRAITEPLPKYGGMGYNARMGMEAARGKTICLTDGDGQIDNADVIRVYQKLRNDHLGMCKARRMIRHDGLQRKIISKMFNYITTPPLFPRMRDRDINGKPKIFSRETLEKLNLQSNDWFLDGEIMIKATKFGVAYDSVPTVFYAHKYRRSYVKPSALAEFLKNLVLYRIKYLK